MSCRELKTKLSKIDPFFFRYTAKPDLRHLSDQDRLDPEPGRTPTPRMGLDRLSRNTQHMRLQLSVKRKREDFFPRLYSILCQFHLVNFRASLTLMGSQAAMCSKILSLWIVHISNALSSFHEIAWHMRKLNFGPKQESISA